MGNFYFSLFLFLYSVPSIHKTKTPPRAKSSNWINFLIFLLQFLPWHIRLPYFILQHLTTRVYMCIILLYEKQSEIIEYPCMFWLEPVTGETETSILDNNKRNTKWKTIFFWKNYFSSPLPLSHASPQLYVIYTFFFGVCCSLFFSFNHAIAIYVCWSEIKKKNITLLRELNPPTAALLVSKMMVWLKNIS